IYSRLSTFDIVWCTGGCSSNERRGHSGPSERVRNRVLLRSQRRPSSIPLTHRGALLALAFFLQPNVHVKARVRSGTPSLRASFAGADVKTVLVVDALEEWPLELSSCLTTAVEYLTDEAFKNGRCDRV